MADQPSVGHGRDAVADVNRRLYYADNLPVLRGMASESVDLVYLDPPFNSNRTFNIIHPGDLGKVTAFDDTWYWDGHCDAHLQQLARRHPVVHRLLQALVEAMGKVQMCAYLVNMGVRLVELHRILKPTGSLYLHCDDSAGHYLKVMLDAVFGPKQFRNDIAWRRSTAHNDPSRYGRILDSLLFYGKSGDMYWDGRGSAVSKGETEPAKTCPADDEGTPPQSLILSPMGFTNFSTRRVEYLSYPTLKPMALLDRLIRASCPPGGLVLDPFCGCGTTVAAAEILQRRWIGIDITYSAIAAIKERFRRRRELYLWGEIEIVGEPRTVDDVEDRLLTAGSEAAASKEFEKFCVATIGGLPNNKLGADDGIDGRIPLAGGLTAICSVKSGRVGVKDLRELKGLLNDKQVTGVLITRRPPTRPMRELARQSGLVAPEQEDLYRPDPFPQLQVLTLEEILTGQLPRLPYASCRARFTLRPEAEQLPVGNRAGRDVQVACGPQTNPVSRARRSAGP